jgi:hypothetical protein
MIASWIRRATAAAALSGLATLAAGGALAANKPGIDQALHFHSQIRDLPDCDLTVTDGTPDFGAQVSNPAASCPDAFAWLSLLETIKAEFWADWAYDGFTFPAEPYKLCAEGDDPSTCCSTAAGAANPGYDDAGNPGKHCPYFPGDHEGTAVTRADEAFKQHFSQFQTAHSTIVAQVDPGRVIRQEMAEIVYRNRPLWSYLFENDLYNTNGLAARFQAYAQQIEDNAPYRPQGLRISVPGLSVMFKTDWLHVDEARALGLDPDNTEHPYVTMDLNSAVGDNDPGNFVEGRHILVAITAASKALPNWHWYAIEHVDNPGRCDYTGCNDAFGYTNTNLPDNAVSDGGVALAGNYIKPHTQSDGLKDSRPIFDTGKPYASGTITPALKALYEGLGVGTGSDADPATPSVGDPAWFSYRLKGSQSDFVTSKGLETVVGNSVTEGGFVNSSSCMTCHAQAAVDASGGIAIGSVGFSHRLNLFGYQQSAFGPPELSWYYTPGTDALKAMQVDFVWGILFANELTTPDGKDD